MPKQATRQQNRDNYLRDDVGWSAWLRAGTRIASLACFVVALTALAVAQVQDLPRESRLTMKPSAQVVLARQLHSEARS